MDVAVFAHFKKKRHIHEDAFIEKNTEEGACKMLAKYQTSIELNVLHMISRAEWTKADSVDDKTDQMMKKSKRPVDELKGKKIDFLVEDANVNMKIEQASSSVRRLAIDYDKALENAGFSECSRV